MRKQYDELYEVIARLGMIHRKGVSNFLVCEAIIPCASCLQLNRVIGDPKDIVSFIKDALKFTVCTHCGHILGELKTK